MVQQLHMMCCLAWEGKTAQEIVLTAKATNAGVSCSMLCHIFLPSMKPKKKNHSHCENMAKLQITFTALISRKYYYATILS